MSKLDTLSPLKTLTRGYSLTEKDNKIVKSAKELKKDDKVLVLTKNEMIIFSYLLNNKEKIVSRDELMTYLWNNEEYINDNALTVNISS